MTNPTIKIDAEVLVIGGGQTGLAMGMTWQYTRTSALLGWVGEDAAFLADQIEVARQAPAGTKALAPSGY